MVRKVDIVILCEDSQHEALIRRFLKKRGYHLRAVRVEKAPGGRGAGEQFVRECFPIELEVVHRRSGKKLVVMIDGDQHGVQGRIRHLESSCQEKGVQWGRRQDLVAVFVPTRNIETWFRWLEGHPVNETDTYPKLPRESECQRHVNTLHDMCFHEQRLRDGAPSSLKVACKEYKRLDF